MKLKFDRILQRIRQFTQCLLMGHLSTGTTMWDICDRCGTNFGETAGPSQWIGEYKITRSPGKLARRNLSRRTS